tara:strand:- start:16960 stop:18813 length:1854 start_codon:yes stop_codon:yes gene_type:complete
MPKDIKNKLKNVSSRTYLAKDFDSLRADLLGYAKTYFPDKIQDFSESSLGGMLLDFAAMVGDNLSFYLDHQFNELNPFTAIEPDNVISHLRNAGVDIVTASPAVAEITFSIQVPHQENSYGVRSPNRTALPIIQQGTVLVGPGGIKFTLIEDINMGSQFKSGDLRADVSIAGVDYEGAPTAYNISQKGICVSGQETTETFFIPNVHEPFRQIDLGNVNVTEVISVYDTNGNQYYEVSSLVDDVVYGGKLRPDAEGALVEQDMEIIPAPRRFVKIVDPKTKITTLQFGGGTAKSLNDDIIPDPSELALKLYGKKTFSRFVIDPNSLLETKTLGIAPVNTTLSIKYRFGGGLSHNVNANSINTIETLQILFPNTSITKAMSDGVKQSIAAINTQPAGGGLNPPTLDDLRAAIASTRNSQARMVTRSDLYARIFTLPARFGRVYRAMATNNPMNPLASNLYVISLDREGRLTVSPDALKKNLRKYLNEFRLVSDAVDILDTRVLNFGVEFSIVTHPSSNKSTVVQEVIANIRDILTIENFQIGQPIVTSDIVNIIVNTEGVIAIQEMPKIIPRVGIVNGREYSIIGFEPSKMNIKGMIVPMEGGIFELRYPDFDIIGTAS